MVMTDVLGLIIVAFMFVVLAIPLILFGVI